MPILINCKFDEDSVQNENAILQTIFSKFYEVYEAHKGG